MNIPSFEINNNILNLVTKITEKLTKLEMNSDRKKNLYLRKISKIKSVNSSCAIEANTLTEEEVMTVINGRSIVAPQKEIIEVKNAYNVYDNILEFDPYTVESFLSAHMLLTANLIKENGKFRTGDVGVYEENKVIHIGARPEYVPKLIEDLFIWAEKTDLNPLVKSSIVHFEIEFIHPFNDGNGRIGRLWQSLILYKYNKIFEYLPIETLVYENQKKYYEALAKSEIVASSTIFIEFMLEMILQTIDKFDVNGVLEKIKKIAGLTNKESEILKELLIYFDKNDTIDIKMATAILNKNEANTRKYLRKFIALNILIPIGKTKGRKYKINKGAFENI